MDSAAARARMVERQLRSGGITDERVLRAMADVPREMFLPERLRRRAYDDSALPIGCDQTMSQPWVVAAICEALELGGDEDVLDVGAGSGYSTAVLATLARRVVGVEIVPQLARGATAALAGAGVKNAEVIAGDAAEAAGEAGFDAIAVHAAAPAFPARLATRLRAGGRLVAPIAQRRSDALMIFRRDPKSGEFTQREIAPCRFVPLRGADGFA